MKLDAHQHFWRYTAEDYGWIDDAMSAIRRDFLPTDLAPVLAAAGLDGAIAVQARQTLAETDWLLELATAHPEVVRAVVGWVPLRDVGPAVGPILDGYIGHKAFKGVRHVLQGEPDAYMADPSFHAGVREVTARGLTYDLLIFGRQLPAAIEFVDCHPNQRIVLDHIAKPVVKGLPSAQWLGQLGELARRENVMCKFSGVVTEVPGWQWTPELLRPYFDAALVAFGPKRLMFGSDWPVCLVASDYARWFEFVRHCIEPLSADEQAAILGGNAARAYRIAAPAAAG